MAEFSANAEQNVLSNQPIIFTESPVPCTRGLIYHRDESGVFRLASPSVSGFGFYPTWNSCNCCNNMPQALYTVEFHGNISIPEGGTVEEIQLAVAIDGEIDPSSIMRVTPAAVEQYWNVGAAIRVAVPAICRCSTVSIRNISTQAINVQNANLIIVPNGIK